MAMLWYWALKMLERIIKAITIATRNAARQDTAFGGAGSFFFLPKFPSPGHFRPSSFAPIRGRSMP
jgi:hypothetical protein